MMTVKNLVNIGFVGAQRGENHLALRLMTDKQTGKHRSFGFCEYHGTDAAQRAVSNLNGAEINGRHLKVAACNNGDSRHAHQASTSQTLTSQTATKRSRGSSSDRDVQAPQRVRTHKQTPSPTSVQALAQTHQPIQQQTQAPQVLNLLNTTACTITLKDHPTSNTLFKTWIHREQDMCLFSVRLIGDSDRPHEHVGIGLADLLSHSLWAQTSYDHKDDMQTRDWTTGGPVHVVLPVCTSPDAVRKIVQAVYSGKILLGDDAEEILILASAMQVEVVTEACLQFLLQPGQLMPQQLAELYLQTCHLTSARARKQALHLLITMPWTEPVYSAVCQVFKQLLHTQPEICKELLLSEASGHMCGMQFGSDEMRLLRQLAQEDVTAASRELLEACVLHSSTRCQWGQRVAQPVTWSTRMVSHTSIQRQAERDEKGFRFRMLDGPSSTYLLTIPTLDDSLQCTLSMHDGRLGEAVQRVGLYLLHHQAPFVQPVLSQTVSSDATEVVLPITGKQVDAVQDVWFAQLGLCTQLVSGSSGQQCSADQGWPVL